MSNYLKHKPGSIEEVIAKQTSGYREDSGYQKMFKKELDKAGKGIGSMSPAEKKAFFNKIDKKYTAKDEGLETMLPVKKDDPKDMKRKQTMTGEKATKINMEPETKYEK
tara:strand:+ start:74 stop:400 length:327 start_codon:yes stop_codon:yes gene_type:complete